METADCRWMERRSAPENSMRRGSARYRSGQIPACAFRIALEYVWADGNHHLVRGVAPCSKQERRQSRSVGPSRTPAFMFSIQCGSRCHRARPANSGLAAKAWLADIWIALILTAERFMSISFAELAESNLNVRLYRTGDLVRYRSDGTLDFLGRMDHQIKLRGFRIELGEIESALRNCPGVVDAVTLLRQDSEDKRLVAYLISADEPPSTTSVRDHLRTTLPDYMVPAAFVFLKEFPRLPNGKLDRNALPAPERSANSDVLNFVAPVTTLQQTIADVFRHVLDVEQVGVDHNFFDLGAHSLQIVRAQEELNQHIDPKIPLISFFQYPTIRMLANFIEQHGHRETCSVKRSSGRNSGAVKMSDSPTKHPEKGIAIVGLAGRFPGASHGEGFLAKSDRGRGVDSFRFRCGVGCGWSRSRLDLPSGLCPAASSTLHEPDFFDAAFFGFSAREAEIIDPQQRVFLECAWEALEDAACDPSSYPGAIGVFAGAGMNMYGFLNLFSNPEVVESVGPYQMMVANDKDFLCSRVAYKLNLKGPAVAVQTACSTSLVAVQMAFESLLRRECDMALAGGVSISIPQSPGYLYVPGMILSRDGHCRAFDAAASGMVPGAGAGIAVLKRLEDAIADGDHIYAVIRGAAVNNDGSAKAGYSAPSIEGQSAVILKSMQMAGFAPESIGYIEAHGTGTEVGDPIEIAALSKAFESAITKPHSCALGSVKTNIGHLDTAAGIAGLIKTALCVERRTIPATLHFSQAESAHRIRKNTVHREHVSGFLSRASAVSRGS